MAASYMARLIKGIMFADNENGQAMSLPVRQMWWEPVKRNWSLFVHFQIHAPATRCRRRTSTQLHLRWCSLAAHHIAR